MLVFTVSEINYDRNRETRGVSHLLLPAGHPQLPDPAWVFKLHREGETNPRLLGMKR